MSLRTRHFREAEHRVALVDAAFDDALARARQAVSEGAKDLNAILRAYLREALERDLEQRMDRPPGRPVYAHWWEPGDPGTAMEADLEAIRNARASLARDLATNDPKEMEGEARTLLRRHGLPDRLLRPLALGLLEA
ncbi:MAG: hypothetical protein IRZ13_19195, partial [Acetobacteraceae bacterium]|nr:hypothetical protein [Acetobacteraceae bacterium]